MGIFFDPLSGELETAPRAAQVFYDGTILASYGITGITQTQQALDTVVQDFAAEVSNLVPKSFTVNGHALSSNITLSAQDVLPSQTGNSGKVLGTNGTTASWVAGGGSVAWGSITGTLSSQTDLQSALNGLASLTATQTLTGINTFDNQLNIVGTSNISTLNVSAYSSQTQNIANFVGTDGVNTLTIDKYGRLLVQTTASAGTQAGLTMIDTAGNTRFTFFNNGSTYFSPAPATSSQTTQNSGDMSYYSAYWNGSASVIERYRLINVRNSAVSNNHQFIFYNNSNSPVIAIGNENLSVGYGFPGNQAATSIGKIYVMGINSGDKGVVIRGSSTPGNALEIRNSSNAQIASISGTGVFMPVQAATTSAPTYVQGGVYFDTTLNKLRVGGASGWETITSA